MSDGYSTGISRQYCSGWLKENGMPNARQRKWMAVSWEEGNTRDPEIGGNSGTVVGNIHNPEIDVTIGMHELHTT